MISELWKFKRVSLFVTALPYGDDNNDIYSNDDYEDASDPSNDRGSENVIYRIPKFTSEPVNEMVNEGGTIRLPCIVDKLGKIWNFKRDLRQQLYPARTSRFPTLHNDAKTSPIVAQSRSYPLYGRVIRQNAKDLPTKSEHDTVRIPMHPAHQSIRLTRDLIQLQATNWVDQQHLKNYTVKLVVLVCDLWWLAKCHSLSLTICLITSPKYPAKFSTSCPSKNSSNRCNVITKMKVRNHYLRDSFVASWDDSYLIAIMPSSWGGMSLTMSP